MQSSQQCLVSHQTSDVASPLNAPVIGLMDGSIVTGKMWLTQLYGLSDAAYHVIASESLSYGALGEKPFTFAATAECVATIMRQNTNGRTRVVGFSLGDCMTVEQLEQRSPEK